MPGGLPYDMRWWSDGLYDAQWDFVRLNGGYVRWYNGVKDHYLGNVIVAPWIVDFYDYYYALYTNIGTAARGASDMMYYLDTLDRGWLLTDLFAAYFPNITDLNETPEELIDGLLGGLFPDWYWFKQNPAYMVEFWLTETYPWLADFLLSPGTFIIDQIDAVWPDFYWLRQDPAYLCLYWLGQSHAFFTGIDLDPAGWFESKVAEFAPKPPDPLVNPWQWLVKLLNDNINASDWSLRASLWGLGEHLLRWMVEGVW